MNKLYPQGILKTDKGKTFIVYTDVPCDLTKKDFCCPPKDVVIIMDRING